MSITDTLTTAQDQVLDALEKIQEPAVEAVRKVAETIQGIVPENAPSVPGADSLPDPKAVLDNYFAFRQKLLDQQREFVTALLDAVSTPKPKAKPAAAKKAAAA